MKPTYDIVLGLTAVDMATRPVDHYLTHLLQISLAAPDCVCFVIFAIRAVVDRLKAGEIFQHFVMHDDVEEVRCFKNFSASRFFLFVIILLKARIDR